MITFYMDIGGDVVFNPGQKRIKFKVNKYSLSRITKSITSHIV